MRKNIPSKVVYGFSRAIHGNMAFTDEAVSKKVLERRDLFLRTLLPLRPLLFTVRQIHGNKVVLYDDNKEYSDVPTADAIITRSKRVALGVLTADCLPIILYDRSSTAVGVIHAGRVGTLRIITAVTINSFLTAFNIRPCDVFVVVGPGIGNCCYDVREDALRPFERYHRLPEIASKCSSDKWKLDIERINAFQALELGVPQENILLTGVCTMCSSEYFSFRRDGTKNRFLSVVSLAGSG